MPTPKLRQQFVAALEDLADPAVVADVSRFFRADPNGHSRGNKVPLPRAEPRREPVFLRA